MDGTIIRPMRDGDLEAADRIFRLAFGTLLRLPDPLAFEGDAEYVRHRFTGWPEAALVAEKDGKVVGSILSIRRGSFAFFGPLSITPELWEGGIAKRLVAATVEIYERWKLRHSGLFTFADSAKHVALYQKFGFWPMSLMAVMARPVAATPDAAAAVALSALSESERESAIASCARTSDALFGGLDASDEIRTVARLGSGDTALVRDGADVVAFGVCHAGAGSEAGGGACLVKFGVVRPDAASPATFDFLIAACDAVAAARGAHTLLIGVDLGTRAAYRGLMERGFRTQMQGVAMHRPDAPSFLGRDTLVLGDWR